MRKNVRRKKTRFGSHIAIIAGIARDSLIVLAAVRKT
jgi:hypothetical protein